MTDHKALAQKHIEWAHIQQSQDGEFPHTVRDNALLAQAEATLYLAEQQRIANLIALGHLDAAAGLDPHGPVQELIPEDERVVEELGPFSTTITPFRLRKDIREALGLS